MQSWSVNVGFVGLLCVHFLFLLYRDPFRAHREHMRQMMRSFSEPLGGSLMPSITDGRNRGRNAIEHPGPSHTLRNERRVRTSVEIAHLLQLCAAAPASFLIRLMVLSWVYNLIGVVFREGLLKVMVEAVLTGNLTHSTLAWGHVSLVLWRGQPLGLSGQLYLALRSPIYSALFHWHTMFSWIHTEAPLTVTAVWPLCYFLQTWWAFF